MFLFNRAKADKPDWFQSKIHRSMQRQVDRYFSRSENERSQTTVPVVWKQSFPTEVNEALASITKGCCAFCEMQSLDLKAYRFRPPAYARPEGERIERECYLWLALEWENLFPICPDCRNLQSQDYFPVFGDRYHRYRSIANGQNSQASGSKESSGDTIREPLGLDAEMPILLEPGDLEEAMRHLRVKITGELEPIEISEPTVHSSEDRSRGELTIHHFYLNHPRKVQARGDRLFEYGDRLVAIAKRDYQADALDSLFAFHEIEFGGAWYTILRRIVEKLSAGKKRMPAMTVGSIQSTFKRFHRDGVLSQVEDVLAEIHDEDTGFEPLPSSQEDFISMSTTPVQQVPEPRDVLPAAISKISIRNFKALERIDLEIPRLADAADQVPSSGEVDTEASIKQPRRDLTDLPQTPALLILGENATGKSSILEAIALAMVSDPTFEELNQSAKRILLNPEYMGSFADDSASVPTKGSVRIELEDGDRFELDIHGKLNSFKRRRIHSGGLTSPRVDPQNAGLIFAYGAHRLFGRHSSDRSMSSNVITLFENGVLTINPEKWLIELSDVEGYALDDVVGALREIIQIDGEFETIDVESDPLNPDELHCVIKLRRTRTLPQNDDEAAQVREEYTVPIRLDSVSSGYRVLIALVCDIIHGLMEAMGTKDVNQAKNTPCVVLIDEIEAHLHPRWKMQVIDGLRKALPKATFIMTSHDPLCVRGMNEGEVQVLNRYLNNQETHEGSKLNEVVESVEGVRNSEQFTVGQLLTSDLFQLFTTDDPVIERVFAEMGDALSGENTAGDGVHAEALDRMRKEIAGALPVGDSEAVRMVQEVVVEYLADRRSLRDDIRRREAKAEIRAILDGAIS